MKTSTAKTSAMKTSAMNKHQRTAKYVPSDFPVDRLILEPGFYEVKVTSIKHRNYETGDFIENFQLSELNAYIQEFLDGAGSGFHPFQGAFVDEGSILLLTDDWVCQDFAMHSNFADAGVPTYLWQKAIHEGDFIWLRLSVIRSRKHKWKVILNDSAPVKKLERRKTR